MDALVLKDLLSACFCAKHIVETLPQLPKGMKPSHIHVLDAITGILACQPVCRVSDVSTRLQTTMPSITKLIKELESLGMVEKKADETDKRVALVFLTANGQTCVKRHVTDFHREWAEKIPNITDEEAKQTIDIIKRLEHSIPGREGEKNDGR